MLKWLLILMLSAKALGCHWLFSDELHELLDRIERMDQEIASRFTPALRAALPPTTHRYTAAGVQHELISMAPDLRDLRELRRLYYERMALFIDYQIMLRQGIPGHREEAEALTEEVTRLRLLRDAVDLERRM